MILNLDLKEFLVVGDIHGNRIALEEIASEFPGVPIIAVGDLVDRGPDSKGVLDLFMHFGWYSVLGNHEHMMLDSILQDGDSKSYYDIGCWYENGGSETVESFNVPFKQNIPKEYISWINDLPLLIKCRDVLISHAPIHPRGMGDSVILGKYYNPDSCIWFRGHPKRNDKYVQISGHNRVEELVTYTDDKGVFGLNLNTINKLTAIHFPSGKVVQKEIIKCDTL